MKQLGVLRAERSLQRAYAERLVAQILELKLEEYEYTGDSVACHYIDPYLEGGKVVKIAKQGENTWLQPEYA